MWYCSNPAGFLAFDPTDDAPPRLQLGALALLFGVIATLAALDLVTDAREGATTLHFVLELGVAAAGALGLAVVVRKLIHSLAAVDRAREHADTLAARLDASASEAKRWRDETRTLVSGLGEAIDRQLVRWELSDAEKEVAMLLLKGLSHKEIAEVRGTTDATTRQQARAVYKKAGLGGRNDLAAFFLEDLLLPISERDPG